MCILYIQNKNEKIESLCNCNFHFCAILTVIYYMICVKFNHLLLALNKIYITIQNFIIDHTYKLH